MRCVHLWNGQSSMGSGLSLVWQSQLVHQEMDCVPGNPATRPDTVAHRPVV